MNFIMVFLKFSWLKLFVFYINTTVHFIKKTLLAAARSLKNIFKVNKFLFIACYFLVERRATKEIFFVEHT